MEFYLVKEQPLILDGADTTTTSIKPGVIEIKSPSLTIGLEPVVENSEDAKYYCSILKNSLIENPAEWKQDLDTNRNLTSTLRMVLTMSRTHGHVTGQLKKDTDDNDICVLYRLVQIYGEKNIKVKLQMNLFNSVSGKNVDLQAKELAIRPLDKDNFEFDFVQGGFSWIMWSPLAMKKTLDGHVTLTVTLSNSAVSRLFVESFSKVGLAINLKSMLEEAICADLMIMANDDVYIPCHKAILSMKSNIFKDIFQNNMNDNSFNQMNFVNTSEAGVRAFLAFTYYLDLEGPLTDCQIALELLQLGYQYSILDLQQAISGLICAKPNEWFTVDVTVKTLLFIRTSLRNEDYKEKLLKKVAGVMKWHSKKTGPNSLLGSQEYQKLFQNNPDVAMELSALVLKLS